MSAYIETRRETFGVEPICRVLEVPVSTFYARRSRVPCERELSDRVLLERIGEARSGKRSVYGARKTWKELRRRGVEAGRDQVARVMRQHGLKGKAQGRQEAHCCTISSIAAFVGLYALVSKHEPDMLAAVLQATTNSPHVRF